MIIYGMYGIGDNIHQRAVLRVLMRRFNDLALHGFYPSIVHDLMPQLRFVQLKSHMLPRIRTEMTVAAERAAATQSHMSVTYSPTEIKRHGSILAAQFMSCGVPMPTKPDFSLPVPEAWRARVRRAYIDTWRMQGKPLLVYRPIVLNKVWEAPSRSPDPVAYAAVFKELRERFFVVSVADLTQNEWIVGDEQDADVKLHQGQLDFEMLAGLFAESELVFCNPGFAPVLAQAVGTRSIIVYGGNESFRTTNSVGVHLAPTLAIEPINPCECHARTHACDKTIDVERALERVRAFL